MQALATRGASVVCSFNSILTVWILTGVVIVSGIRPVSSCMGKILCALDGGRLVYTAVLLV